MSLYRLIYVSKVKEGLGKDDLDAILNKALDNNKELDITGMLIFNHKYFFQVLEGARNHVNQTYNKIVQDERHYDCEILSAKKVNSRIFTRWEMRLMLEKDINRQLILKYSPIGRFDPYRMANQEVDGFFLDLAQTQSSEDKT